MKNIVSKQYHVITNYLGRDCSWLITGSYELAEHEAKRIAPSYPEGSVFVVEVVETREVVFKTW